MAVEALERLTTCLSRLPGIGRKSAERMAMRLAADPSGLVVSLVAALEETKSTVRFCSTCGAVSTIGADPCKLCTDPSRDARHLCVVEEPGDIVSMERAGAFPGRYHALMGRISPMKGDGPDDIRVDALLRRVQSEGIEEVILALSTDMEGDATAAWLADRLRATGVRVSRLAYGLPAGSGIRYADEVTLSRALRGRQEA